jgi:outer membrane protein OmpA-like peptidoglycan-associated protein
MEHFEMRFPVLIAVLALAAGCATPPRNDLMVVLPEQDGKVGAVVVSDGKHEITLDSAYASARSGEGNEMQARTSSADEVRQVFGAALAAQPARPVSLTLYFTEGSTLSGESKAVVDKMFAEIARRSAAEITVIGHTDTIGADAYNDKLSLERAQAVREILVGMGVSAQNITAAGRGKRELLVPTAENVNEPRNRRVELSVR